MTLLRSLPVLAIALSTIACSQDVSESDGPTGNCTEPNTSFGVGTGEDCFVALADNAQVSIIAGSQGGLHVWLSVACVDCGDALFIEYAAKDPQTDELLFGESHEAMFDLHASQTAGIAVMLPGGGFYQEPGQMSADDYVGQQLTLWATVTTDDDEIFSDEVTVTVSGIQHQSSGCPDCN
jgi:hypothetical protein